MSDLIGRVSCRIMDLVTGNSSASELNVRLGDVSIIERRQTKREKMIVDLSSQGDPRDPSFREKMREGIEALMKQPSLDEVVSISYSKSIRVDDEFKVAFHEHPGEHQGFGLTGERVADHVFSWEWFTCEQPSGKNRGIASKLQETGVIAFEEQPTPCGVEITFMRFETDVSLRMQAMSDGPETKPRWRILIEKGSEIYWPSLVWGAPAPNGFLSQ